MDAFSYENKKVIWITLLKCYNIINSIHITYHPTRQFSGRLTAAADFGVMPQYDRLTIVYDDDIL